MTADFYKKRSAFYIIIKNFGRCIVIKKTEINEDIRDREIRVLGADGEQLGLMSSRDALELAIDKKLDLVKIAPQAKPPVCRIMDYGKHKYELQKREKENKKKQKTTELKEVRLSLNIEKHDLETKVKMATKFLAKGDKVKVSLRLRGREMGYTKLAVDVINRFALLIEESGKIDKKPAVEGRSVVAFFSPINN